MKTNKQRTHTSAGNYICDNCGKPIRTKKGEKGKNGKAVMEYDNISRKLKVIAHRRVHAGRCPI